jgi:tetratricopeptide (TPR) repeat protein
MSSQLVALLQSGQQPSRRPSADAASSLARGLAALEAKNYAQAISEFTEALRHDGQSARAYGGRAQAHAALGHSERALRDAGEAIRLDPKLATAYEARASALIAQHERERAIADCSEAIRLDPGVAAAHETRGFAYRENGEHAQAIADYTEAIRLDPQRIGAYTGRARAHRSRGEKVKANADLEAAIGIAPKTAADFVARADAFEEKGDLDAAIADCNHAVRLDAKYAQAFHSRGYFQERKKDYDPAIASLNLALERDPEIDCAFCDRGNAYFNKGDFDKAITEYSDAIRHDPREPGYYFRRGNAHRASGDYDKAIADYSDAIRLDPKSATVLNERAYAHRLKGDLDRAIADCNEAIRITPNYAAAFHNRGWAYENKGDRARALADFTEAIRIDPGTAQGYRNRGYVYRGNGELDKAIADYTEAIRLDPKLAAAHNERGVSHYSNGDIDKAIADWSAAIGINAKDAVLYANRGVAYRVKGDYDKAVADFTEAIRLNPKGAETFHERAYAHRLKGDFGKAIADSNEAIRIAPNYAVAYHNRGWAYENNGDHSRAVADFTEGIRIDPRNAQGYRNRGYVYRAQGEFDKAITEYTEAIRLDPKSSNAYTDRGGCHRAKGDFDKAVADLTEAIRLNPRSARAYNERANAHERAGKLDAAILDYSAAIRLIPKEAAYHRDRGRAYQANNELDKAIDDYSAAVRLDRTKAEYSDALVKGYELHLQNLAGTDKVVEAIALAKKMHLAMREIFGEDHLYVLQSLMNLARLYEAHEDFTEAAAAHQERMDLLAKQFGQKHPRISDARYARDHVTLLGRLAPDQRRRLKDAEDLDQKFTHLSREHKYHEALAIAQKAAAIRKDVLGEQEPAYSTSLMHLGDVQEHLNAFAEAEAVYLKAAAIRLAALGETHPEYATCLFFLGKLHMATREYAKAEPLFREAAAICKVAYGADDALTIGCVNHLIEALEHGAVESVRRDDFATARNARQRVVALRTEINGDKHWQTTDARVALAQLERLAALAPDQRLRLAEADRLSDGLKDVRQDDGPNVDDGPDENLQPQRDRVGVDRYKQALQVAQRVLDIRKEILGEHDPDFASSLFKVAFVYHLMDDRDHAEPLYRQALKIHKETLGEEHPKYLADLHHLGAVYAESVHGSTSDKYSEAEAMLQRAAELVLKTLGEKHGLYIASLYNLGALYRRVGAYAKAEPLLRTALELREQVVTEARSKQDGLGDLRKRMGMDKDLEGATDSMYGQLLTMLGEIYLEAGDYAAAEPLYRRGLDVERRAQGEKHWHCALILNELATLYWRTGDYTRAEALYREAQEIDRQRNPHGPPDAGLLNNLARLLYETDNYKGAESLYRQALESQHRHHGGEDPGDATILDNLALCYTDMGEFAKAEPLYLQALKLKRTDPGDKHPRYAASLNNLAYLHQKRGEYSKSEPLYRQALEIYRPTLGEAHPEYTITLNNLARLYWEMRDKAAAAPLMRKALEGSAASLERAAAVQSERQQISMARTLRYRLDNYLSLIGPADERQGGTYRHVLAWKGSVLLRQRRQRLLRHHQEMQTASVFAAVNDKDGRPVFLMRPRGAAYDALERVANRLSNLTFAPSDSKQQPEDRRQSIQDLTEEKERLEGELAGLGNSLRKVHDTAQLTPEQLQAALPPETVLVDFLEYNHSSPAEPKGRWAFEQRLAAFVVRRDRPVERVELGPIEPIAAAVDAWRKSFGTTETGKSANPRTELRRLVWAPLEVQVKGAKVVLVSPDGPLTRFPLAALPGKQAGSYLLDEVAIAVVPVPQLLPELLAPVAASQGEPTLLVVGDVAYDAEAGKPAETVAASRAAPRGDPKEGRLMWPPLGNSLAEIAAVEKSFQERYRKGTVTELRRAGPTVSEVCKQAPKHRYLHFATHGFFAPPQLRSALALPAKQNARPGDLFARLSVTDFHPGLLSGIVLAGANRAQSAEQDDGILTALEVAELDLAGVDLATLSACHTGLGESAGGEGLLGLQRAFQEAGARTVLATMWEVDDEPARELMERFYANLWKKGMGRLDALRDAQLWMLGRNPKGPSLQRRGLKRPGDREPAQSRLDSPRHWAAFVLSGDWR